MSTKNSKKLPSAIKRIIEDRVIEKIEKQWEAHRKFDSDLLLEELAADNARDAQELVASHGIGPEMRRKYRQQMTLMCWGLIQNCIERGDLPPFKREHLQESSNMH